MEGEGQAAHKPLCCSDGSVNGCVRHVIPCASFPSKLMPCLCGAFCSALSLPGHFHSIQHHWVPGKVLHKQSHCFPLCKHTPGDQRGWPGARSHLLVCSFLAGLFSRPHCDVGNNP